MGDVTGIEWTNKTWNPWHGCKKVSPGCAKCYMFRDKKRYGQDPLKAVRASPQTFNAPLKWADPALVFTCSWSDFFIDVADPWRDEAWDIIKRTPHLTYQILTKRPERIAAHLPADWGIGYDNVWLGVSVESDKYTSRVDTLIAIPARRRFISYEPALGPVNWSPTFYGGHNIHWIISGGESDSNPRPADLDWFRATRDFCAQNGIAYFHKQNGGSEKIDGTWGGKELDGKVHHDFPNK